MLSTNVLDCGNSINELEIVVTNHLDEIVDIKVEENQFWLSTLGLTLNLGAGESKTIKVSVNRALLQENSYSVPMIINVEKDIGFDIIESYTVIVNVEK